MDSVIIRLTPRATTGGLLPRATTGGLPLPFEKFMQIFLPPEVEALLERQLTYGKYNDAIEVILAGIKLLEQQEDIYQGRLEEVKQEARIGLEASQQGKLVEASIAMAQIRANLQLRYHVSDEA